jgi:RNA polymerase sigma-70 factor (ECF subfamily)
MRPRAAQVLVLRHSGLSYAEIAAAMNVAVGSVGTLLARAEKAFERHYRALEETNETL